MPDFDTERIGNWAITIRSGPPRLRLKIPLGRRKRWYTQLEYFGIVSEFRPKNFSKQFVDTGLHYFITPHWEIGASVSFGINEQTQGTMVNVGMGFQF